MSKRGGARLFVAAGQPQGGGCIWKFKGGVRITQGGQMPPSPPEYTPADTTSNVASPTPF